jgi:hypothetical protein
MTLLPHLAARLYGVPLAIHRPKLDVILAVLGPRRLADLAAPGLHAAPRAATQTTKVAVIPIHGTLVRRTVGLEAESGLTSYAGLPRNWTPRWPARRSPPSCSTSIRPVASRAACSIWPTASARPADEAGLGRGQRHGLLGGLRAGVRRQPVFVSRTGGVGSIGVIAMHVDQSEKDAQDGVRYTAVFAGDRKNDLNPHEPISSEAHAFLKAEVNRIYDLFVETVAAIAASRHCRARHRSRVCSSGRPPSPWAGRRLRRRPCAARESFPHSRRWRQATRAFSNHQMESSMNDRTDPAALDRPLADPAGSPSQPATAMSVADAVRSPRPARWPGAPT